MKLTQQQIASIAWPKGATHMRIETTNGKTARASRKEAPKLFADVEAEIWQFGILEGKGKATTFKPLANPVALPAPIPAEADNPATQQPKSQSPKVNAKTSKATKAPKVPRKLSKCAFIDEMLADGKHTMTGILSAVLKEYPEAKAEPTMRTIHCRPAHMRKKGLKPIWLPEPKEAAPAA